MRIQYACFPSGERYPVLLDEDGSPSFWPTLFVTICYRNSSKAANTIVAVLQALKILFSWSQERGIDLHRRLTSPHPLSASEIDGLVAYLRRSQASRQSSVVSQIRGPRKSAHVSSKTHWDRLTYIAEYLIWVEARLPKRAQDRPSWVSKSVTSLLAQRPSVKRNGASSTRLALSSEAQEQLLELISAGSNANPFADTAVRIRNELIVRLFLETGMRVGELLALKVADIDFQSNKLTIARRHDEQSDIRRVQPVVKTRDRVLPIDEKTIDLATTYVTKHRAKIKASKKNPYLFVTHKKGPTHGAPLSYRSILKIFRHISDAGGDDLKGMTPHVLRHTMNYNLSLLFDKSGQTPEKEEKIRSYINGWKEGSGTASTYLARHTQESARKALMEMQKSIRRKNDGIE